MSVAFCTSPHPSSQTNAAISVIREAAPPPTEITKPYASSISDFLVTGSESIRSRLIAGRGLDPTDFSTVAEEFAAELGLEVSDFVAARNLLAEQHVAFGRSTDSIFLPPRALAGGVPVTNLYASTATPPAIPDLEYYAWLARDYPSGVFLGNVPDGAYAEEGWAHFVDYALTETAAIVSAGNGAPPIMDEALDPYRDAPGTSIDGATRAALPGRDGHGDLRGDLSLRSAARG